MAVVMTMRWADVTPEQYDAVRDAVRWEEDTPSGAVLHVASFDDDGLLIQIVGNGAEVRPVAGLPAIRDADVNLRISGRTAVINVGRGNVDISPGRKLSITNGVFEVPDTFPKAPPAKARFRLDGSVPAAAELLGMERLRDYSGAPIDPATSRGTLTAQVTLAMPLKDDHTPSS